MNCYFYCIAILLIKYFSLPAPLHALILHFFFLSVVMQSEVRSLRRGNISCWHLRCHPHVTVQQYRYFETVRQIWFLAGMEDLSKNNI
jgi:hypothetical protein